MLLLLRSTDRQVTASGHARPAGTIVDVHAIPVDWGSRIWGNPNYIVLEIANASIPEGTINRIRKWLRRADGQPDRLSRFHVDRQLAAALLPPGDPRRAKLAAQLQSGPTPQTIPTFTWQQFRQVLVEGRTGLVTTEDVEGADPPEEGEG